jgi:2-haloacid dehalogenase
VILQPVELAGIAFDAFGTLFDLNALRTRTRQAASHEGDELFASLKERLIPWTWHLTASGGYAPFPELASLAVQAAGREAGLRLERSRCDWIVAGMNELPVFDDVKAGLERLRGARIPMAVLSNGTSEGIESLVAHNGLEGTFDHLLVADSVKRFKPAPEVYGLAAAAFAAPAERVMLVTGHEWDVAGAARAGLKTGWVARGEDFTPVLGQLADVEAPDLRDLADQIAR